MLQSPFDACFSDEATAEVVLLLASSSFGAVGSSTRDTLLGSFEARVAQVVGTAPGHVVVTRVVPRSGLLQFRFKRLVRNTTSAVPVRTMVARFEAAYANASSALFLPASATTQYIDASRPLTVRSPTSVCVCVCVCVCVWMDMCCVHECVAWRGMDVR